MKGFAQTTVIPCTLAAIIGLGAVALPSAGRSLKTAEPEGQGHSAHPQQDLAEQATSHSQTGALDEAVIASAGALPPSLLSLAAPTLKLEATLPASAGNGAGSQFEIGDKLKVVVYERVEDVQQNKWGRDSGALTGFAERPEFGGEYNVETDGTITVPLLGQFPAAGRSARDLQDAISAAFQELTARRSLVTIMSSERPPVYVLGPVKNPGTYKFTSGMTVLHAVALAGGYGAQKSDPWQQLEAVKAADKRRASLQLLPTLLARMAVLKAEFDGVAPKPSSDLLQLTGDDVASMLVAQEIERRKAIVAARQTQKDALQYSLTLAQQEIQRLSKVQQPLDQLIRLRKERADAMQGLAKKGTIGREVLIQAQADLSEAEQRREDASNQRADVAQHQLAVAQQDIARFQADTTISLRNDVSALDQQISALDGDAASSLNVLSALQPASYAPRGASVQSSYKIVRQTSSGPVEIAASGLTVLQPGDLVQIDSSAVESGTGTQASGSLGQSSSTILIHDSAP